MNLGECDFGKPEAVVAAFIRTMNSWELFAANLPKAEGLTQWEKIDQQMDAIFAQYCTPKERKQGRQSSFQSPPEYDPKQEAIISTHIETATEAFVDTRRDVVLGCGNYRYVLHRKDGRWLIDNLKFRERDGSYSRAIL
jgi:hypothetical protein